jgi:hypothetical protein
MTYLINSTEYLEIGGVPLQTPAWTLTNLETLWAGPPTRGTDRVLPGAAGVRSYRRRATVAKVALALVIFGEWKWDGAHNTDIRAGLLANVDHLRTNITDPTLDNPGTRVAVLHLPGGTTRTGAVTVEDLTLSAELGPFNVKAVIDISIAQGALA